MHLFLPLSLTLLPIARMAPIPSALPMFRIQRHVPIYFSSLAHSSVKDRAASFHSAARRPSSLQTAKLRETFPRIFLSHTLAAVRESFPVRRDAQPRTLPVNDPPRSQISYNPQLPSPMGVQGAPVSVSFFLRFISIRSGAWFN